MQKRRDLCSDSVSNDVSVGNQYVVATIVVVAGTGDGTIGVAVVAAAVVISMMMMTTTTTKLVKMAAEQEVMIRVDLYSGSV